MHTVMDTETGVAERREVAARPRWRLTTRLGLRFAVVYFTSYILATQMVGSLIVLPVGSYFRGLGTC